MFILLVGTVLVITKFVGNKSGISFDYNEIYICFEFCGLLNIVTGFDKRGLI